MKPYRTQGQPCLAETVYCSIKMVFKTHVLAAASLWTKLYIPNLADLIMCKYSNCVEIIYTARSTAATHRNKTTVEIMLGKKSYLLNTNEVSLHTIMYFKTSEESKYELRKKWDNNLYHYQFQNCGFNKRKQFRAHIFYTNITKQIIKHWQDGRWIKYELEWRET